MSLRERAVPTNEFVGFWSSSPPGIRVPCEVTVLNSGRDAQAHDAEFSPRHDASSPFNIFTLKFRRFLRFVCRGANSPRTRHGASLLANQPITTQYFPVDDVVNPLFEPHCAMARPTFGRSLSEGADFWCEGDSTSWGGEGAMYCAPTKAVDENS